MIEGELNDVLEKVRSWSNESPSAFGLEVLFSSLNDWVDRAIVDDSGEREYEERSGDWACSRKPREKLGSIRPRVGVMV